MISPILFGSSVMAAPMQLDQLQEQDLLHRVRIAISSILKTVSIACHWSAWQCGHSFKTRRS